MADLSFRRATKIFTALNSIEEYIGRQQSILLKITVHIAKVNTLMYSTVQCSTVQCNVLESSIV